MAPSPPCTVVCAVFLSFHFVAVSLYFYVGMLFLCVEGHSSGLYPFLFLFFFFVVYWVSSAPCSDCVGTGSIVPLFQQIMLLSSWGHWSDLMIEHVRFSEMSVHFYQATQHHIAEDCLLMAYYLSLLVAQIVVRSGKMFVVKASTCSDSLLWDSVAELNQDCHAAAPIHCCSELGLMRSSSDSCSLSLTQMGFTGTMLCNS